MSNVGHYQVQPWWAGLIPYAAAWEWQQRLVAEQQAEPRQAGKLLLLEHPPTYTLGRSGQLGNLLLDQAALDARGIALHRVDRGGDITYHGPGQLVGYPILNLNRIYAGYGLARVKRYVSDLEELLIQTLDHFGIEGRRLEGHRGVWVERQGSMAKIAAIGVRIGAEGISSHGFALNVDPDLSYFEGIVPCGIQAYGVTSMRVMLGHPIHIDELLPHIAAVFGDVFGSSIQTITTVRPPATAAAVLQEGSYHASRKN